VFPAIGLPDLRPDPEVGASWVPVDRFRQIEPRLRAVEGLSFVRRSAKGAPAGRRTATVRAVTGCRVAVVPEGLLDREALAELAESRSSERRRRA
jgi:hypothetical protein